MNLSKTTTTLFFLLLLLNITAAWAQQHGGQPEIINPVLVKATITGQVINAEDDIPLEFATITLFNQTDSSLVTGGITDLEGKFALEAKPGEYYAVIEFISFESKTINDVMVDKKDKNVDLGVIKMLSDAAILNEVEVVAEKSTMQLSLDKKVFNVGKDLATRGGTALDVLDNVPSVTVDVEGNVSLRGSSGVRILVDGRPSGLIGVGGTSGLRNFSANMIEKIEVITNPSSRYEAEGMAGIINIVLKKDQQKGLNGSFDLTVGQPDQYGAAINLNYRRKNLNFFTNYGLRYRSGPGISTRYNEFYKNDTTFITDQISERTRGGWSNSIRLGADYFLNPKNTLTTSFLYRIGDDDNSALTRYFNYINTLDNLTDVRERSNDEIENESNLEYALNYKSVFKNKDHFFTADIRFQDNTEEEGSDYTNRYFNPDESPSAKKDETQRSNNLEGERNLILQMDYVQPIGDEGRFELGYRSGFRSITNDYLVEDLIDGDWERVASLSNDFRYDENIHALYSQFGNKFGPWSFQVGLRAEYSDVTTELIQTNELNPRDYFNLFPSAFLNYELNPGNSLQASYSRRIRRPRFWDLNPFFTFSDDRNFFSGNPDLDPEFTDSYELGYARIWEKASLTSAIFYRHTTDVIDRISKANPDGTTTTQPENLLTEDNFGFEFTFSSDLTQWWKVDGNVNLFRSITDGGNLGENFQADTYTAFGRMTSKMTIFKDIDTQIRVNYRAPRKTTQGTSNGYSHVDLAVAKDVMKKKGTLTLSVRDVFNSRRRIFTSFGDNFYSEGNFQWRARSVTLSLNYRLNQNKRRGGNRDRGGDFEGGEEQF